MNDYERIKRTIEYHVNILGKRDFVIYPFGNNGQIAKKILNNDFGIFEKYIIDQNKSQYMEDVHNIDFLKKVYNDEKFYILLTIHTSNKAFITVHQQISEFAQVERIIDIFSISTFFNPWMFYEKSAFADVKYSLIESISREIYENGILGEVAEAGVYKGGTARIINRLFPDRKLFLFDTFSGFDERDLNVEKENKFYNAELDFSDTSEEIVLNKMIYPQNCVIKKGWFPESTAGLDIKFCFVRLDMDLYTPIYEGLNFFYSHMDRGYICVHDCRSRNFEGARIAIKRFCKEKGLGYVCMPDELGTAVIAIGGEKTT